MRREGSGRSMGSLLAIVWIMSLQSAWGAAGNVEFAADRIIVRFKETTSVSLLSNTGLQPVTTSTAALVRSLGAGSTVVSRTAPQVANATQLYTITDGASVMDKMKELQARSDVAFAEPDYKVKLFKMPGDPNYDDQWYLPKISAPLAWDTTTGSRLTKVCVIDSGVRVDHPDLAANIIKGWNLVALDGSGTAVKETDTDFKKFNDTLGHGTHVAGLVGAMGNNARGVSGVAWRTSLLVCKFIADSGGGDVSAAITCMQLCRKEGAHIYTNSWGGVPFHNALLQEIYDINKAGGLVLVAAGNNGANLDVAPSYPAAYSAPNLITVAASTIADNLAPFSAYGRETVQLAAPGVDMLSTMHGGYEYMSGTSMATPLTAGAAALLQSMALNTGTKAPLTPAKLKSLLMSNVDPISDGATRLISKGRLNVAKAVAALKAELGSNVVASPPPPIAPKSPPPLPVIPKPSPPPNAPSLGGDTAVILAPECGTSALRGRPANQSSVAGIHGASKAVDGDCRNDWSKNPKACASTSAGRSHAWWTAPLASAGEVQAVSLTTRADCCWNAIGGAIVMVGNQTWTGSGSKGKFKECGRVPASGITRGQRMTIRCSTAMEARYVAVYLPKLRTSMTLCEVDVTLKPGSTSSSTKRQPGIAN